jgi:hypothetical protein
MKDVMSYFKSKKITLMKKHVDAIHVSIYQNYENK